MFLWMSTRLSFRIETVCKVGKQGREQAVGLSWLVSLGLATLVPGLGIKVMQGFVCPFSFKKKRKGNSSILQTFQYIVFMYFGPLHATRD